MQNLSTKVIDNKKNKENFLNFILNNKKIIIPFLFIIFYVLLYFLIDFSNQSLVAHDEGLYSRRARLIEDSNNWFSPPFLSPHHKTLGSYWFIALSIKLFGNSELALRLPSILASFLSLFISYWIALKISNKKAALLSIFSLSSMPLWIKYSRYASPDILFVLCILLVVFYFLKSLEKNTFIQQHFYIFISGIFISISFFIRSYMAFVPLIGLSPFVLYHLSRKKYLDRIAFLIGILIGSIPTFLNLYFSFKIFGIDGITSLFDFAREQAIGEFDMDSLFLIPFKFLYLTFPTGLLTIILFVFTRSNNIIKYPLLVYIYPLSSLAILLSMSTSYPHYYLFLLPSLSILFSIYLTSSSFRFSISKFSISSILIFCMISISFILLFLVINYKYIIIDYISGDIFIVYVVSFLLVLSYLSSIRFLFNIRVNRFNLVKFFYNLVVPQYISLSLLFNFGVLGNPNFKVKSFLKDDSISSIINTNKIYLYNMDSKIETLLSFYLPSSEVIQNFDNTYRYEYLITSDNNFLDNINTIGMFKSIKNFDNHFLLMNIGN